MAKAYTKDEVVAAALMRFEALGTEYVEKLRPMYLEFYDKRGKTEFRTYASVTPGTMKAFFDRKKNHV